MNFIVLCFIVFAVIIRNSLGVSSKSNNGNNDGSPLLQRSEDDIPGEPLSPLDFKNAENLSSIYITQQASKNSTADDPTENAGLFEGDIVISHEDRSKEWSEKNAVKDVNAKWKNGTVPYLISSKFNEHERSVIASAVLEYQRQTCIKFTPRSTENDYIMITSGKGCSSQIGRGGGLQYVTLGEGCLYTGIVMHELMHTVGFWHEQSRWDRDDHVVINFENIQPGMENNFRKLSQKESQNLNAPYDTFSIMHYGPYAFSKNPQKYKTIVPKVSNEKMGQRTNFSETDVSKINRLYDCSNKQYGNDSESNSQSESSQKCTDNHHNCQKWASSGECQNNPNWMLVNCKQSCNQCRASCSNNNKHCDSWAATGECSKNPGYMNSHCAKACKQCR